MSAQWVKFTGSEEQISEMREAKDGFKLRNEEDVSSVLIYENGSVIFKEQVVGRRKILFVDAWRANWFVNYLFNQNTKEYLICQPHPHADMIIEWARTGREVYVRGNIWDNGKWRWELCKNPSWIPQVKYSFDPDGDSNG